MAANKSLSRSSAAQMHMEFIPDNEVKVLSNSGVESQQLLFPENSPGQCRSSILR